MSIISRYLLGESLRTIFAVLFVLLLILFGGLFAKMLGQVAAGKIAATVLLPLVFVVGIKSFPVLLTVALYIGVLVTLGRFYKDNEMTALRAAGAGYSQIAKPILVIAILVATITAWLAFWVQPQAQQLQDDLRADAAQNVDIAGITPGKFIHIPSTGSVVFAESIKDDALEHVYMFSDNEDSIRVIAADSALQVTPEIDLNVLELQSGSVFESSKKDANTSRIDFQKQGFQLPIEQRATGRTRLSAKPMIELIGAEGIKERAELQWRFSYPISALLLVALALPLSYTSPRKGQFAKLALAIIIYIVYQNLLGVAQNWMVKGTTPTWLGIWWVHACVLVLIVVFLLRHYQLRYLLGRFMPHRSGTST